ncbi:MAG: CRTAC1 family protein [Methylococcaceae bacterium]|jgi:hypothetical protein
MKPSSTAVVVLSFLGLMAGSNNLAAKEKQPRKQLQFENIAAKLKPAFQTEGFSFMPGVGFIDYNNDSHLDIYVMNGKGKPNGLYRSNADGSFTDVAAAAGVADLGQGLGVAVGDLNNDGFDDLYVANGTTIGDGLDSQDGPDKLYINNRDGTFREISAQAGISENGVTSSVAMADYDNDGDLDIMVGRWVDFDFNPADAGRDIIPFASSHLYRNNGNLTFTDVTAEANVVAGYNTWAIVWMDYDNDVDMDLFLAYERGPIDVFRNDGKGKFTRVTEQSGDLNAYGAWMGITVGDYNNDGLFDIFSTNISDLRITRDPALPPLVVPPPSTWDNPRPTLFRNNGDGTFTDVGKQAINSEQEKFSWGCAFADFNNDGWVDIYDAMNLAPVGVIGREREGAGPGGLHINNGDGTFDNQIFSANMANFGDDGNYLDARGLAIADFNKDGQMDLFLQNVAQFEEIFPFGKTIIPGKGTAKFFKNLGTDNNWLELRLIGAAPKTNLNAVGAKVTLTTRSGKKQVRTIVGGASTYSASSRIIHFGLKNEKIANLEVRWPNGYTQWFDAIPANKLLTLVEGRTKVIQESDFEGRKRSHYDNLNDRKINDRDDG